MTDPSATPTSSLIDALEHLTALGKSIGISEDDVLAEGLALSAAVLESGGPHRAPTTWADLLGRRTSDFFDAAPRGRRYLNGPTLLLSALVDTTHPDASRYAHALVEVATAACTLDGAPPSAPGRAAQAGQAQLSAAGIGAPRSGSSASMGLPGPADLRESSPLDSGWARFPAAPPLVLPGATPPGPMLPGSQEASEHPGQYTVMDRARRDAQTMWDQLAAVRQAAHDLWRDGMAPPPDGSSPGGRLEHPSHADLAAEPIPAAPVEVPAVDVPQRSVEELLAELDDLVGLDAVKREIHRQVALLRIEARREKAGLKSASLTRHLVFVGNPGTGKTTVARLVGGIYRALGLLSKGQLVEVDRAELVAGYLGQTAQKTTQIVASALGGVLFIDEAYTLKGDQYAQEAVDTLVKEMEDHRDDLVVIVAGYPGPMAGFIAQNPGLASRFRTTVEFDDYSDQELQDILTGMAARTDYDLTDSAVTRFREILAATPRGEGFGNGRFARNTLEAAIGRQAWRLRDEDDPTLTQLRTLDRVDLEDRDGVDLHADSHDHSVGEAAPATGSKGGPVGARTGTDDDIPEGTP
ncbi:Holliday junction ATP-dependent DNA helicase RuvB [Austwickia sp. TVS 96-490-7B]|uniref:AAA family ATPase n=1 Tax=Austwickia sp. TVS 96-490-7B TaxID=2830843 RepID=UPI001C55F363|nr:AAA family ATPase [Austwickia sp. TVS 96-490-7B]MBW3084012.1 Holliday junction ATP-dependent DNA helicase RuvB [Austwickia sp. TVS 96-490-7B]